LSDFCVSYSQFGYYSVDLTGLSLGDSLFVPMKFDTGSPYTLISVQSLYSNVSIKGVDLLRDRFSELGIQPLGYVRSATGHPIEAYPLIISNVYLNDELFISKFPFYLVLNVGRPLALLGDDFVSCCSFSHEINSDIVISRYENELSLIKFKSGIQVCEVDGVFVNEFNSMLDELCL